MRLLTSGPSALLAEVSSVQEAMALYDAALAAGAAARDVVPAARSVLFDGVADLRALARVLQELEVSPRPTEAGRRVELPTVYDGPDLPDVARIWDMTRAEVVRTHTGTDLTVAFCGFAPGFAYCVGLGRSTPRLDSPRSRVPAGSVGLAGEFTGVYPTASPGGWRLLGHTDATLWDLGRESPALLTPGTTVRFLDAGT